MKDFSILHLKTAIFLALDWVVRHVTSQEDMNDNRFLPLDVANVSTLEIVSFLWGSNLNKIFFDAGLD